MLWQTEENNGIYIDLLKNINYVKHNYRLHRKKNTVFSSKVRMEGNDKYKNNDYEGTRSACL